MYASGGGVACDADCVLWGLVLQTNACALGLADGVADACDVALALGLGDGECTAPTVDGDGRSGPATNRTPTIRTAITAAATPAIQYGARSSGACARAERTRSGRLELGEPLTPSKTLFSSRRKSSLLTSEHLLDREVVSKAPGRAVDPRLCGGRGHAQRPGQLFERKVEIEMEDEREALFGRQP